MPKAMNPNSTYDIWLESDSKKPKESRPTFVCRYLSGKCWLEVAEIHDRAISATNIKELYTDIYAALKMAIVDWRNMIWESGENAGQTVKFSQDSFEMITDLQEAYELLKMVMQNASPSEDDAKKSESPSPSSSEKSVKTAAQASAPTAPAK